MKYVVEIFENTGFEQSYRDGGTYPSLKAAVSAMEGFPLSCFEKFCIFAIAEDGRASLAYEMT